MGISFSLKFKSEDDKTDCINFIDKNKEEINSMIQKYTPDYFDYFDIMEFEEDENISYGLGEKNMIGYKYSIFSKPLYYFMFYLKHKFDCKMYLDSDELKDYIQTEVYEENNSNLFQFDKNGIFHVKKIKGILNNFFINDYSSFNKELQLFDQSIKLDKCKKNKI